MNVPGGSKTYFYLSYLYASACTEKEKGKKSVFKMHFRWLFLQASSGLLFFIKFRKVKLDLSFARRIVEERRNWR